MEQLVTFETARAAKRLGFTQGNQADKAYTQRGELFTIHTTALGQTISGYEAPTQAILQRWFREVKKWSVEVNAVDGWRSWVARVYCEHGKEPMYLAKVADGAPTYEEALENGLAFASQYIYK